ncbi:MAG: aromatic ring-hydroxylating dioxygenase subunit alpha [Alphaproteobacteria bacterium]
MARYAPAGLTAREIRTIHAPIGKALTLPARAYASEDFFALEVERIFKCHWMAISHEVTVARPGDVRPIELCGVPLVVVRGDDGRVRVFHNICPYDGCPVALEAKTGLEEIVGYYHGWRYDLRGRLVAAPYWGGSPTDGPAVLGRNEGDLAEVRSETRLGVVFVNLDGRAPPIDDHLAPLRTLLAEYDLDGLVQVEDDSVLARDGRFVQANWKTYLENAAINILHESFTHESYRRSPEVPRVKDGKPTFFLDVEGPLLAFGYDLADVARTYDSGGATPHIGRSAPPTKGYFITLYPNIVIPIRWNVMRLNIVLPQAPNRTRLLHCGYFSPKAPVHPDFPDYQKRVASSYREVYREDQVAIEAVQKGRGSPVWQQHYYAPFWDELHYRLNRLVARDVARAAARRKKAQAKRRRRR